MNHLAGILSSWPCFFCFMLLHQSDRLLIGPLTTAHHGDVHIDEARWARFHGRARRRSAVYPLWGYLYDRFARANSWRWPRSFGAATWLSALAPRIPLSRFARDDRD